MGNPGLGVMIQMLGGDRGSRDAMFAILGKKLAIVELRDDALWMTVEGGPTVRMSDHGQSCCESRYMRTDDDLASFVGATLTGVEVREAPSVDVDYDAHDVEFLAVQTDRGEFVMSSHNEHNGYYGGFAIRAEIIAP